MDDRTYKVYHPISNMFPGVELVNALQDLSTASGVPIIPDPNVTGQVNVNFENVSLEDALEMMLAGKPYVYKRMPRYYLVADRGINGRVFAEISETRRVRLNYIQASRAKALLSPVFAQYVQAEPVNPRDPNDKGNTLIVTASPAMIDRIVQDIREIDSMQATGAAGCPRGGDGAGQPAESGRRVGLAHDQGGSVPRWRRHGDDGYPSLVGRGACRSATPPTVPSPTP